MNPEPIGNYSRATYQIKVQRRSGFFVSNIILPSILINYLSSASFLIPTNSDENIGFSVTIFLAQAVNLLSTSQFIPNGGIEVPVWGKYLVVSIVHLTAIILLNIKLASLRNAFKSNKNSGSEAANGACKFFAECLAFLRDEENVTPKKLPQIKEQKKKNQQNEGKNDCSHGAKLKRIVVLKKIIFIFDFLGLTVMTVTALVKMKS